MKDIYHDNQEPRHRHYGIMAALSLLALLISWQCSITGIFWPSLLGLVIFAALAIDQAAEEEANSGK